jgi:hypothetical protein
MRSTTMLSSSMKLERMLLHSAAISISIPGMEGTTPPSNTGGLAIQNSPMKKVYCRRSLRDILSRYLRIPPADIKFRCNVNGKRMLYLSQNEPELRF